MRAVYILLIATLIGLVLFGCIKGSDYQQTGAGKPGGGAAVQAGKDVDSSVLDVNASEPDSGDELGLEVPE